MFTHSLLANETKTTMGEWDTEEAFRASAAPTRTWDEPNNSPATAEGHLDAQGYGGARSTTLLYLSLQLQGAGKTSAKLTAAQSWLDGIISIGAMNPDAQHAGLPAAPFGFAEVCQEALATLQGGQ